MKVGGKNLTRAFVSIEISDEIKQQLINVQEKLTTTGADLKLVEPQNIHLTLRFLGDVSEGRIEEIKSAIRDAGKIAEPYDLKVEGLGVFPHLGYIRVIWAGVGDGHDSTAAIRKRLDKNLADIDFSPSDKEFTPHITFARMRSGKAKGEIANLVKEMSDKHFGTCRVEAIELKKSELTKKGPIYSTLERVELS